MNVRQHPFRISTPEWPTKVLGQPIRNTMKGANIYRMILAQTCWQTSNLKFPPQIPKPWTDTESAWALWSYFWGGDSFGINPTKSRYYHTSYINYIIYIGKNHSKVSSSSPGCSDCSGGWWAVRTCSYRSCRGSQPPQCIFGKTTGLTPLFWVIWRGYQNTTQTMLRGRLPRFLFFPNQRRGWLPGLFGGYQPLLGAPTPYI